MKQAYRLVVFDMAGTTIDEDNLVYKTLRNALERAGLQVPLATVLDLGAGKEKRQAIHDIIEAVADRQDAADMTATAFEDFRTLLATAYDAFPVKPMPGAEAVFRTLQAAGIRVVLNTGYDRPTADKLLRKLGWETHPHIDLTVTASDAERSRPFPDMILLAMERLGVDDPTTVVKVGDAAIDVEEGHQAGCGLSCGVTTGAQTAEQLSKARPHHILAHLGALPVLLGIPS
jgi:phosphonatase-like hydrolase